MHARDNRRRRARARRRMRAWENKLSTQIARLRRKWKETYPEVQLHYKPGHTTITGRLVRDTLQERLRQASKPASFRYWMHHL